MPEVVIPELLWETAADIVVAGKYGSSEIVDLFLGSMTKHLLLDAPCDVLVIPPNRVEKT
jgi:nucleotide-binding universal stress UspA family protein